MYYYLLGYAIFHNWKFHVLWNIENNFFYVWDSDCQMLQVVNLNFVLLLQNYCKGVYFYCIIKLSWVRLGPRKIRATRILVHIFILNKIYYLLSYKCKWSLQDLISIYKIILLNNTFISQKNRIPCQKK
jgi:hypothetical protein